MAQGCNLQIFNIPKYCTVLESHFLENDNYNLKKFFMEAFVLLTAYI